ncbi:MAG: hypothetical protein KatS3mg109_1309 [Pirellulaceae bacterium]|nr:MAG: hypothetical protein KatS3mg109_1309 [Pirellulaceae bacterium]GIW92713.1 MAG: hypothetical protein KatS3mg110_0754 [Pirellulaceae bacterium]
MERLSWPAWKKCPWSAVIITVLGVLSTSSELRAASPLWERLFGRSSTQYVPVGTQYVPVTTYYPVTTYLPVTTYSPVTTSYPVTAIPTAPQSLPAVQAVGSTGAVVPAGTTAVNGLGMVAPPATTAPLTSQVVYSSAAVPSTVPGSAVAGAVPASPVMAVPSSTSYRTIWYRVPVTSFRPTTTIDPATGMPTTVMVPCTTYTWQARRVPVGSSDGFLGRLFGHRRNNTVAAPPAPAVCVPPTTSVAPTTVPATPGTLIPPTPPSGPLPSATAPGTSFPGTAVPGTSVPLSPGGTPGGAASGSSTIREPADMPPSLDPSRYSNPPAPAPGSGSSSQPGSSSAGGVSGNGSGVSASSTGHRTRVDPSQAAGPPAAGDTSSETDSLQLHGPLGPDPDVQFQLRPIPDPRALRLKEAPPARLVQPRDRTAQSMPNNVYRTEVPAASPVAIEQVGWRTPNAGLLEAKQGHAADGASAHRATNVRGSVPLDDGGWRSRSR